MPLPTYENIISYCDRSPKVKFFCNVINLSILTLVVFAVTLAVLFSSYLLLHSVANNVFLSRFLSIMDKYKESNKTEPKMVCYYVFPSSKTDLQPEEIGGLCTHIIVGFAGINTTNYSLEISSSNLNVLKTVSSLRSQFKGMKVSICVGGAGFSNFGKMVKTYANRKMFIQSVMQLLQEYKLDGLDLDWEWPVLNGVPKEKVEFIQLLSELRQEFDRHKKKYFLSAAVAAAPAIIDVSYYSSYLAQYVDFINLMSYDYHFFAKYYPVTDYNAPLYPSDNERGTLFEAINVNYSIFYWMSLGMPKGKIIMGLPTYGHTYKLWSSMNNGRKAPAQEIGTVGSGGFASYFEICQFLNKQNTVAVFDNATKVPYAYNFLDWISYDDEESLSIKVDYVLKQKLGGVMVFSLNSDDFRGGCNSSNHKFPLIQTIKSKLQQNLVN